MNKKVLSLVIMSLLSTNILAKQIEKTEENNKIESVKQHEAMDLKTLLKLAKKNDSELMNTSLDYLKIYKQNLVYLSKYAPQLKLNTAINYDLINNDNIPYDNQTTGFAGLVGSYDLYNGEKKYDENIADENLKTQSLIISKKELELKTKVTVNYYNILKSKKIIEVNKENLRAIEEQYKQIKEMVEVGLKSNVDLKDTEAKRDQIKAELIASENKLINLKAQLFTYTAQNIKEIQDIDFDKEKVGFTKTNLTKWNEALLNTNLDLLIEKSNIKLLQSELLKSNTTDDVKVKLNTKLGANYNNRNIENDTGLGASFGVSIDLPLLNGGYTENLTEQKAIELVQGFVKNKQIYQNVKPQMEIYYNDLLSLESKIEAYKQSMNSAKISLDATKAGFTVGTRTIVDVLNANTQYYMSKENLSSSKYDYLIKETEFANIIGLDKSIFKLEKDFDFKFLIKKNNK